MLLSKFSDIGIVLANENGYGRPILDSDMVAFNGDRTCNHQRVSPFVNPWPSRQGGGIAPYARVEKQWSFAGTTLESRCCGGNCAAEAFQFPRMIEVSSWSCPVYEDKHLQLCETAFRPYDIAVTASLIVAKHHLGDKIRITSDGNHHQWFDAKLLCELQLGYGMTFELGNACMSL